MQLPSYGRRMWEKRKALYGTRLAAASWGDELRKVLVRCNLTVGTVSRCCSHIDLCSVAGTVHGGAGCSEDVGNTQKEMGDPRSDDWAQT